MLLTIAHGAAADLDLGLLGVGLLLTLFGIPVAGLLHLVMRRRRNNWSLALGFLNALLGLFIGYIGREIVIAIGAAVVAMAIALFLPVRPPSPTDS